MKRWRDVVIRKWLGVDTTTKWYIAGTVFVVLGYAMGLIGKDVLVIPSFAGAFICAAIPNLDHIKSFKAAGFEAEMQEVRVAAKESRELALVTSKMLLSLVQKSGRFGGYSDTQQNEIKESVDRVLTQFTVGEHERRKVYSDWNAIVKMDYVFGILGQAVPQSIGQGEQDAWKTLRERNSTMEDIPSPDELYSFLERNGFLAERAELMEDYRYYVQHFKHRRPDVWAKRREWRRSLG